MTEPSPDRDLTPEDPSGPSMPRWVPVLIGLVLVVLAALAVYTGLQYREGETLTSQVKPQRDTGRGAAPPGEPDAGASLVLPGSGADNTPSANEPVQGSARAVITGGAAGVQSTVRMWASRGMMLRVTPSASMVYVNDLPIGEAAQFDTDTEVYDFAQPGSYTVRVVAPGGAERTFIVTANDDAERDIAIIEAALE